MTGVRGSWPMVLRVIVVVLVVVFLGSGARIIHPGEVGIVLRFGKLPSGAARTQPPGLLIAFPYPIDEVIRISVESIRQITIDNYWEPETLGTATRSFHPFEQDYCLTGDYNVVLPKIIVKYQVSDAVQYTLAVENPELMLQDIVSAELVRTVGEMGVDYVMTEGKAELAASLMTRSQDRLDAVDAGLRITAVEISELIPPRSILPDFQSVQSASIEKETAIRNAQAYREEQVPQAEAEATRIVNNARAYDVTLTARANADANAFMELLEEYRRNPEVVMERLRNEYMARALSSVARRYITPGPPVTGRVLIPPEYGQ